MITSCDRWRQPLRTTDSPRRRRSVRRAVRSAAETGQEHANIDNPTEAYAELSDWVVEHLT